MSDSSAQLATLTTADPRQDLLGMTMNELCTFAEEVLGERAFRGKQLFKWIYQKDCTDFLVMTDMGKSVRKKLVDVARVSRLEVRQAEHSRDGTIKFLWGLDDGLQVESVLIPEDRRMTLCISTQVGCPLACDFCVTGKGGYVRNLTRAEILLQIMQAQLHSPERRISNIVLMGMGEPLLNLDNVLPAMEIVQENEGLGISHRRITLSTVGLLPQLEEFGRRSRINLAISLHGTTNPQRTKLMPINRKYPLEDLMAVLRRFPLPHRKQVTIEYILIKGVNDSVDDAHRLVELLRGLPSKVNLIPYNNNPFTEYETSEQRDILAFQEVLMGARVHTMTRLNRGDDISAACGQLGGYKQQRPKAKVAITATE